MERRPGEDATDSAPEPARRSIPSAGDARDRDASAKARAYLDLWERHVVQTALHGPDAAWRPAKS